MQKRSVERLNVTYILDKEFETLSFSIGLPELFFPLMQ